MFGGLFGGKSMPEDWHTLESEEDLERLIEKSKSTRQVIFKHSTRCSISSMAYSRLQNEWSEVAGDAEIHYLDLIAHRPISNRIADRFGVHHESPQMLVIDNGICVAHASHNGVSAALVNQ